MITFKEHFQGKIVRISNSSVKKDETHTAHVPVSFKVLLSDPEGELC